MKITLVQYAPIWEDIPANLSRLDEMLRPLAGTTDLIVLPEMFATGFSMNTKKICNADLVEKIIIWMDCQACNTGAMVAGGVAEPGFINYFNRFYWVTPDGDFESYEKRYLFPLSGEPQHYEPGEERKQFEWRGWQIKPIVCYDLRFPEWCRNSRTNPYDLLICAASWPTVRSDAWLTLLKARALENQCYVAGVNRVGTDNEGMHHQGDTIIYGPKGEIVGRIPVNEETTATFELSLTEMHEFRRKFPVLEDIH